VSFDTLKSLLSGVLSVEYVSIFPFVDPYSVLYCVLTVYKCASETLIILPFPAGYSFIGDPAISGEGATVVVFPLWIFRIPLFQLP
jgi:hypothetical protein